MPARAHPPASLWQSRPTVEIYFYEPERQQFTHPHETYEVWTLLTAERGAFACRLDDGPTEECTLGDLVICPPGRQFHRRALSPLFFHFARFGWPGGSAPDDVPTGRRTVRDLARLRSGLGHLRALALRTDPAARGWRDHLVADLLRLARFEADAPRPAASANAALPPDRLMDQAAKRLRAGAAGKLSLRELAASVRLAPVPFSRRFRRAFGMTPSEQLTTLRLEHAARLLRETDLILDAVAERCGFSSGFYLSRVFSRRLGMSPARFRRAHRV